MSLSRPLRLARRVLAGVLGVLLIACVVAAPADASPRDSGEGLEPVAGASWVWPLQPFRLLRPFIAPPHEYGPGHRGLDLSPAAGSGDAATVRAPAAGAIAFAGQVAGRPVVTIDHGSGLVTTLEPVLTELRPGQNVAQGAPVGVLGEGGHAPPGALHFGVRRNGEYINPLLLLGGVPRAVLLPCC